MRKLLTLALVASLAGWVPWGGDWTAARGESVLKAAQGLASNNITVLINRAVVIESTQPFIEVSVAQPAIADVSPLSDRSLYIFGKERGSTTLTLLGENGALITSVTIFVEPDLNELKERLRAVLPSEPISVRLTGPNIVLSGVVSGKAKIDKAMSLATSYGPVVNMMSVGGTQQVMMKVRIAEMSRSAAKALGFDTFLTANTNKFDTTFLSGNNLKLQGPNDTQGNPTTGTIGEAGDVVTTISAFGALGTFLQLGDFGLGITLQALEQKGFSRTLAEPNLVTLSGNQAKFLAGTEVPIPTVDQDGNTSVTFKEVGVGLNFTPTVLDDDLINLELSTEVSAIQTTADGRISFAVSDVSTFTVRRATTVIELRDGQSFAIAGLLQDDFRDAISQFPWLGDIPVLGTLFRSTDYSRGETELVIIVTAHLVVPVNGDELSLPHDRIRIPNEFELFLLGYPDGSGAPGLVQSQSFDGDYGYVVE